MVKNTILEISVYQEYVTFMSQKVSLWETEEEIVYF